MLFLKVIFRLGLLVIGISLQAFHPAIVQEEFIFTKAPFASCHASTLTEASPGHLLCAYFAGTHEGAVDVAIWLSSFEKRNWSEPRKIAEVEKNPCWNPVLFTMPTGEVLLFYKGGPNPRSWSGFLKRSMTQGKEWSEPELLPAGILGPVRSKPLLLKNGTLLCGSSTETWQRWGCWVDITQDEGRTWVKSNPINIKTDFFGVIQPSFFEGKNGEIKMAMRSHKTLAICLANSHDQGRTWSDAIPTDLPNPNAAVEALTLTDGRSILIFNNSQTARYPLSIALSTNGGESWKLVLDLESQKGEFSYPAAIQTSDGLVHITYTFDRLKIKHVVLDPRLLD
ncbi:MAG: sialidase family protein [Rhabdochlamydiaceae bacterium]